MVEGLIPRISQGLFDKIAEYGEVSYCIMFNMGAKYFLPCD